jgi:hypothetical protein
MELYQRYTLSMIVRALCTSHCCLQRARRFFKLLIRISFTVYVSFEFVPIRKKIQRPMLGGPTNNEKRKLQRIFMVKKSSWKVPLRFTITTNSFLFGCVAMEQSLVCPDPSYAPFEERKKIHRTILEGSTSNGKTKKPF